MFQEIPTEPFGELYVESFAYVKGGHPYWHCSCSCGGSTIVRESYLVRGRTRSCGCLRHKTLKGTRKPTTPEELEGKTIDDYTIWGVFGSGSSKRLGLRCICGVGENRQASNFLYSTNHFCRHKKPVTVQERSTRYQIKVRGYLACKIAIVLCSKCEKPSVIPLGDRHNWKTCRNCHRKKRGRSEVLRGVRMK
jgi:hypothetical protein